MTLREMNTIEFKISKEWIKDIFEYANNFKDQIQAPNLAIDPRILRIIAGALVLRTDPHSLEIEDSREAPKFDAPHLDKACIEKAAAFCGVNGKYRSKDVNVVYGHSVYHPPHFASIPRFMNLLFSELETSHSAPGDNNRLFGSIVAFYCAFLSIHPLRDGNGRVARILYYFLTKKIDKISAWAVLGLFLIHRQESTIMRLNLLQMQSATPCYTPFFEDAFRCINNSAIIFGEDILRLNEMMLTHNNPCDTQKACKNLILRSLTSVRY